MFKQVSKQVKTRRSHKCDCGKPIPAGTTCTWYKSVVFRESDVGRNCWQEGYVCPDCDKELQEVADVR